MCLMGGFTDKKTFLIARVVNATVKMALATVTVVANVPVIRRCNV